MGLISQRTIRGDANQGATSNAATVTVTVTAPTVVVSGSGQSGGGKSGGGGSLDLFEVLMLLLMGVSRLAVTRVARSRGGG